MKRWALKVLCTALVFVLSFFSCLLPFWLLCLHWRRCLRRKSSPGVAFSAQTSADARGEKDRSSEDHHSSSVALDLLMCLGGGVFLGAFLLHMLPEVADIMSESSLNSVDYPIGHFLVGVGFFFVFAIDVLVGIWQDRRLERRRQKQQREKTINAIYFNEAMQPQIALGEESAKKNSSAPVEGSKEWSSQETSLPLDSQHHQHHHQQHQQHQHHHHQQHQQHQHHHSHVTRSIILVLALSLHHIFEGLFVGLLDDYEKVWKLTITVLIHEVVLCFAMGLQFYKTHPRLSTKLVLLFVVFSVILPIGLVIGIIISELDHGHDDETQKVISGVLQALSSGSFLYVTFVELLFEQLQRHKHLLLKALFVLIGFFIEALLAIAGHDHHHGSHGDHHDNHTDDHHDDHHDDHFTTLHHHDDHFNTLHHTEDDHHNHGDLILKALTTMTR